MTEIVPIVPAKGNTKPLAKQANSAKYWCFTWNNYPEDGVKQCEKVFSANSAKFIIGEEVGESGTPHLQGYVECARKMRWSEFKLDKSIHWEIRRGNTEQNVKYCSKDGKFTTNMVVEKPVRCLQDSQLRDWQKEIIEIVKKEPDDRKIYWYWEPVGNMGKTTFAKFLAIKHGAIPIEGKRNDILFCAAEHPSELYIFDFERSMEEFISYAAMEKIKNGFYMSGKYESKPVIRNPPHIICFANFEPDTSKLSADRWVIKKLEVKAG